MPYRPTPEFRRNIKGVIYPLTEAIRRVYGRRDIDNAYPIGAFYTVNVSSNTWQNTNGIWYAPSSEEQLDTRNPNEDAVIAFMQSINTGEPVELNSGTVVTWELIPSQDAEQLPHV